jgi:hypothetical protein
VSASALQCKNTARLAHRAAPTFDCSWRDWNLDVENIIRLLGFY